MLTVRKVFFSEEKKQKTFVLWWRGCFGRTPFEGHGSLVLFFKEEPLPLTQHQQGR
jgi:hypothetical protein